MHVCPAHIYTLGDPSWDDFFRQPSQPCAGVEWRSAMRMDGCEAADVPNTEQGERFPPCLHVSCPLVGGEQKIFHERDQRVEKK